mgnify:CR=1 FL=1
MERILGRGHAFFATSENKHILSKILCKDRKQDSIGRMHKLIKWEPLTTKGDRKVYKELSRRYTKWLDLLKNEKDKGWTVNLIKLETNHCCYYRLHHIKGP